MNEMFRGMRETDEYVFFWGGYLSQWFMCNFFDQDGTLYNCAEQYMMAQKAKLFGDIDAQNRIMESNDPDVQKKIGKEVKNFDEKSWKSAMKIIVTRGNLFKFTQNEKLKHAIIATGDKVLVEASPYDKIWGIGLKWDNPLCDDPKNWQGTNYLGEALMLVRKTILSGLQSGTKALKSSTETI